MRSMTGYGKGSVALEGRTLTVELKSVNNRFLEINSRVPKALAFCDGTIRKMISQAVKRGSIEILLDYDNQSEDGVSLIVDTALARAYAETAKRLRDEFLLEDDFQTTALLRSPDVVKRNSPKDDSELLEKMVRDCTGQALEALNRMRQTEGASIADDLTGLVGNLSEALSKVVERAPKIAEDYREKLSKRMREVLGSVEVDQTKLLTEAAFFADKADVNEEISRLLSHIGQFRACLAGDEPQGRKLDFLSQEMNREINTMGSKSNDIELTGLVLTMKNELEKIKEQIRNVE